MKWFKHYTDAHEGRSLMTMFDELGHAGPNCYWILLEMCAAKLEKKQSENLTEADCRFNFHERKVRERFRLSPTKVQAWFNLASTLGLLSFQISEKEIEIFAPQLIEILEHDQKKSRAKTAAKPPEKRLEKSRVEKNRIEKSITSDEPQAATPVVGETLPLVTKENADRGANKTVWEAYKTAYLNRYGVEPVRNAKLNTNISQFVARLGADDAPEVAKFFVGHNDSFYVKNMHAFGLALANAESLHTQWRTGRKVTATDARQAEVSDSLKNQIARLGGGVA